MGKEIILYDLPSKQGVSWSLNTWKARMALNFKGLDYKTEWVEYPDVEPRLKSFGISPNNEWPAYTAPAIKTAEGEYIMDSKKIAEHLEKTCPAGEYPALKLDEPVEERVRNAYKSCINPLAPVIMPLIPRNLLNLPSAEYFQRTRKESFGMPLDELESKAGGEAAWEKAQSSLDELASILKEEDGPYCLGTTSCWADFIIVTFLHMAKVIDEEIYNRMVKGRRELSDLYTVMSAYLIKAD